MRTADAGGAGNLLMLVGSDTGRDGIHGASGLASKTFDDDRELRPTVQVGNPFLEKVLIEACLEAACKATPWSAVQDLGAAGLTSASVECAHNSGAGIRIDVANVPRRESGMEPYEIMLSESQERMLVVVRRGRENEIEALFDKWDLRSDVIGEVTSDGIATILDYGEVSAQVSVDLLTDPPLYRLQGVKPEWLDTLRASDLSRLPLPDSKPRNLILLKDAQPLPTYRQQRSGYTASTITRFRRTPSSCRAETRRFSG